MISRRLFGISISASIAFVLLTTVAMAVYPGGTFAHPGLSHYEFFSNPFSDLGRTHGFDHRSNRSCMVLFIAAMIAGGAGLASFFIAFAMAARGSTISRMLSLLAAVTGITAAISFVGVACTPWDLFGHLHLTFVLTAFRCLLVATTLDLLAVLADRTLSYSLIGPFAIFICLLIAYILLLTASFSGGPVSNAALQVTGQKIIVYTAILMVLAQSAQMRSIRGQTPFRPVQS